MWLMQQAGELRGTPGRIYGVLGKVFWGSFWSALGVCRKVFLVFYYVLFIYSFDYIFNYCNLFIHLWAVSGCFLFSGRNVQKGQRNNEQTNQPTSQSTNS